MCLINIILLATQFMYHFISSVHLNSGYFWIVMYFVLSGGDQQVRVITLLRCQIPITNHVLSIEQNRLAGELQVVQV